jgi:hypothetical protein
VINCLVTETRIAKDGFIVGRRSEKLPGETMGIYYHLINDTKLQRAHLDNHFKIGPMKQNLAVHFALCSYMMQNLGDTLRVDTDDAAEDYEDVNLLTYKFDDPGVIAKVVELLNACYGQCRYAVVDGVGVAVEQAEARTIRDLSDEELLRIAYGRAARAAPNTCPPPAQPTKPI